MYFPANLTPDSLGQFIQANDGNFTDWHPPLLTVGLSLWLNCGFKLSSLVLLQAFFGSLSVYYLAYRIVKITFSSWLSHNSALFTFLILIIPWSPLHYYLVTFIKDSFFAFSFCWLIAALLYFLKIKLNRKVFTFFYIIFSVLIVFIISSRHNALILFPIIMISQFMILKKYSFPITKFTIFFIMPWSLFFANKIFLDKYYGIKETYPVQQVISQDMISLVIIEPELRNEFPFLDKNLKSNYKEGFEWGNVHRIYFGDRIVEDNYRYGEEMINEYKQAFLLYPLYFLKCKWLNFKSLLSFDVPHYWFYLGVDQRILDRNGNSILEDRSKELVQNSFFNKIRSKIFYFSIAVADNIWTRIFSGINAIWLIVNIISIISSIWLIMKRKSDHTLLLLLLYPFFYYLSYFLATTAHDFRFMYPSTLVMQVLFLSFLFIFILNLRNFSKSKSMEA